MAGNISKWLGAIGLSTLLGGGCASYRNECGSACSNEAAPTSQPRSIFSWRNSARSNQPSTLTITATKPETRTAQGKSSILGEAPTAGSKFNPIASTKPKNSTEQRLSENAPKPLQTQGGTAEADLPVIAKPLGMPIPKAKSNGDRIAASSPKPPKPLDFIDPKAMEPAPPKKLPEMSPGAAGVSAAAGEERLHTLPPQHSLRPAKAKNGPSPVSSAVASTDVSLKAAEDSELPNLAKALAPPSPRSAGAQNNELATTAASASVVSSNGREESPPTSTAPAVPETMLRRTPVANAAKAAESPANSLELRSLMFCTQVLGFGEVERMPAENLTPGRPVLVYAEVRNFTSKLVEGMHETTLLSQLTLETPAGATAARFDFDPIIDRCQTRRNDFYCHFTFALPKSLPPGPYVLRLKIKDMQAEKFAEISTAFEAVKPTGEIESSAATAK